MKIRKDRASPWGKRVFFETSEFEVMMAEVFHRASPLAFKEGEGVDVDRVLFQAFGLEADYVTLPDGVLGRTLFRQDGRAQIEVSRRLAEEAETDRLARRRLRTTLGHEGGHVTCHSQLFLTDTETMSLFGNAPAEADKPAILCRETSVGTGYQGEWWEFQANQCMACLLLPKCLLVPRVTESLKTFDVPTFAEALKKGVEEDIVRALANVFDISWQVVILRLQELGFAPKMTDFAQQRMTL